jgi:hypothetical protein
MNNTTPPSHTALVVASPLLVAANLWTGHPAVAVSIWMIYGMSQLGIQVFSSRSQDSVAGLRSTADVDTSTLGKLNEVPTTDRLSNTIEGLTDSKTSKTPVSLLISSRMTSDESNVITTGQPPAITPQKSYACRSTIAWLSSCAPGAAEVPTEPAIDTHTAEASEAVNSLPEGFYDFWELLLLNASGVTSELGHFDLHSYWSTISSYTKNSLTVLSTGSFDLQPYWTAVSNYTDNILTYFCTNVPDHFDLESYWSRISDCVQDPAALFNASIYPTVCQLKSHFGIFFTNVLIAVLLPRAIKLWQHRHAAAQRFRDIAIGTFNGDYLGRLIWHLDSPWADALRAVTACLSIISIFLPSMKLLNASILKAIQTRFASNGSSNLKHTVPTFSGPSSSTVLELSSSKISVLQGVAANVKSLCIAIYMRLASYYLILGERAFSVLYGIALCAYGLFWGILGQFDLTEVIVVYILCFAFIKCRRYGIFKRVWELVTSLRRKSTIPRFGFDLSAWVNMILGCIFTVLQWAILSTIVPIAKCFWFFLQLELGYDVAQNMTEAQKAEYSRAVEEAERQQYAERRQAVELEQAADQQQTSPPRETTPPQAQRSPPRPINLQGSPPASLAQEDSIFDSNNFLARRIQRRQERAKRVLEERERQRNAAEQAATPAQETEPIPLTTASQAQRDEEEARRISEEEGRRASQAEARRVAEENVRRAEARWKAEENARRAAEESVLRAAEEHTRQAAEENARRIAEDARRAAEEKNLQDQARRVAEMEALEAARREAHLKEIEQMNEEDARLAAEEAHRVAEEQARLAALQAEEEELDRMLMDEADLITAEYELSTGNLQHIDEMLEEVRAEQERRDTSTEGPNHFSFADLTQHTNEQQQQLTASANPLTPSSNLWTQNPETADDGNSDDSSEISSLGDLHDMSMLAPMAQEQPHVEPSGIPSDNSSDISSLGDPHDMSMLVPVAQEQPPASPSGDSDISSIGDPNDMSMFLPAAPEPHGLPFGGTNTGVVTLQDRDGDHEMSDPTAPDSDDEMTDIELTGELPTVPPHVDDEMLESPVDTRNDHDAMNNASSTFFSNAQNLGLQYAPRADENMELDVSPTRSVAISQPMEVLPTYTTTTTGSVDSVFPAYHFSEHDTSTDPAYLDLGDLPDQAQPEMSADVSPFAKPRLDMFGNPSSLSYEAAGPASPVTGGCDMFRNAEPAPSSLEQQDVDQEHANLDLYEYPDFSDAATTTPAPSSDTNVVTVESIETLDQQQNATTPPPPHEEPPPSTPSSTEFQSPPHEVAKSASATAPKPNTPKQTISLSGFWPKKPVKTSSPSTPSDDKALYPGSVLLKDLPVVSDTFVPKYSPSITSPYMLNNSPKTIPLIGSKPSQGSRPSHPKLPSLTIGSPLPSPRKIATPKGFRARNTGGLGSGASSTPATPMPVVPQGFPTGGAAGQPAQQRDPTNFDDWPKEEDPEEEVYGVTESQARRRRFEEATEEDILNAFEEDEDAESSESSEEL